MKTINELKKLGYSAKDINVMSDKKYSYIRFSPEEVLFLEKCVGTQVTIHTKFANGIKKQDVFVNSVSMGVISCSFMCPGFMISCIDKKSVITGMRDGIFIRNRREWNFNSGKGTLSAA